MKFRLLLLFTFIVSAASFNEDEALARSAVNKLNSLMRNRNRDELYAHVAPNMMFNYCSKTYYRDEFIYKLLNTPGNQLLVTYNSYYMTTVFDGRVFMTVEATLTGHGFNMPFRFRWNKQEIFTGGMNINCPFQGTRRFG